MRLNIEISTYDIVHRCNNALAPVALDSNAYFHFGIKMRVLVSSVDKKLDLLFSYTYIHFYMLLKALCWLIEPPDFAYP